MENKIINPELSGKLKEEIRAEIATKFCEYLKLNPGTKEHQKIVNKSFKNISLK
jgi:hypothetical protein